MLGDDASALDLVAALHPTAAVAGVVIDSGPDSELAETRMKFRPIADALR